VDITQAMKILGQGFSFSAADTDKIIKGLCLPVEAKVLDVGTGAS